MKDCLSQIFSISNTFREITDNNLGSRETENNHKLDKRFGECSTLKYKRLMNS